VLAGGSHRRFFCCGEAGRSHVPLSVHAASAQLGVGKQPGH
jgi:hypothetical protein